MNTPQANADRQPNAGPSLVEGRGTPTSGGPTGVAKASPINIHETAAAGVEAGPLSTVHRSLFTLLTLSLLAAFAPRAEAVEATNTGGYVTTYTDAGGTNWIYHVFTNAGASGMKFRTLAAGGTVEVFMVAGGGSGGGSQYNGGAGGAGGLIYTNYTVSSLNTDYAVSVGRGGTALAGNSKLAGNTGENSTFGSSLTAYGGGAGGCYGNGVANTTPPTFGGSGGGGAGNSCGTTTNGASATVTSPMQGNKGGNGYAPAYGGSGGGGGAGYAGGNGTSSPGGNGGDGLYYAAFTNWGDTNTSCNGWFAGGGGGSCYSPGTAGTGGKGGGGKGGDAAGNAGKAGQPNTGGGGGAPLSHVSAASGAGGSGIVIVRYQSLPPVLPASGGDITYPTNLNGKVYGVHVFTSTVGTNYFTPTKALNVEYLVIGGGGGGGGARAGGGGAGGYRCSVQGELSGSNSTAEAVYPVSAGISYPVVVGAGGAGGASTYTGNKGGDSWFTNIVSTGGGGGKERNSTANANGGSGGGGGYLNNTEPQPGGSGTAGQGLKGGSALGNADGSKASYGGGGGGAGSPGTDGKLISDPWGSGGTGLVSSITGGAVMRAGGGGGGQVTWGVATNYGGGVDVASRWDGAISTGGGGAARWVGGNGGNGGSGVVILRYVIPLPPKGTVFMMR